MSERFEVNFNNKEVRMYFYMVVPVLVTAIIFIFFVDQNNTYAPFVTLIIFWTSYYTWRYFYRKKKNKSTK